MLNNFLQNQMYALCILAALSLRQHMQHNWQVKPTQRIPLNPSFSFLKCIDPNNSLRTDKIRRDWKDTEENFYQESEESKSQDFLFSCFQKLSNGAQAIIDNVGASLNNSKLINNTWTKNILQTMVLVSNKSQNVFVA